MKKIVFFIHSLRLGGAERIVSILLKKINAYLYLVENKIDYDISFFDKKIYYFESEYKSFNIFKLFKYAMQYKKFCNKNNLDYSISFLTRPNIISIVSKFFGNRAKIIITEHSLPSLWYSQKNLKSYMAKFLIKSLYNFADMVIAVSNGVKEDLIKLGIKKEKIKVIYNFIDLNEINNKKMDKINDFKFDKFTFITIGRLDKQKNQELIIKAMKKLPFDSQLLIIGDGELREHLENLIKELKLDNRVFILGFKQNPYKYISNSDAFVLSSNQESFGIVLIESLACELPIISTDCISGPREILAPNTNFTKETKDIEITEYGILTPIKDVEKMAEAMKMIYKNRDLRKNYTKKTKIRTKEFDVEKIIKEWEKVLDYKTIGSSR